MNEEVLISREEYNQYRDACKQLQAYKDKEDKLREYIRKQQVIFNDYDVVVDTQLNNILQILNEGDDE